MIGETSTTTFPCGCKLLKRSRLDVGTLTHCRGGDVSDINMPLGMLRHLLYVNQHGVVFMRVDDKWHALPKWMWGHARRALGLPMWDDLLVGSPEHDPDESPADLPMGD